jgi:hypothetical protein
MPRYLTLELFQFIEHASSALRPEENNFEYWKTRYISYWPNLTEPNIEELAEKI